MPFPVGAQHAVLGTNARLSSATLRRFCSAGLSGGHLSVVSWNRFLLRLNPIFSVALAIEYRVLNADSGRCCRSSEPRVS